jgi:hypothetical protein
MEVLRGHGWHSGNWRDDVTGYDNGLRQIAAARRGRADKMAAWVELVGREAEAIPNGVATVWHPEITADEVRAAAGGRAVAEITAASVEDAVRQFKDAIRGR